ncbi:spore cortex-lytic enzyme precursor [Peptococcaceae bacterium CEB3]|nr:spore cortex-lytic enzyme precursor [Peptococcaceae bacterium CEB3]
MLSRRRLGVTLGIVLSLILSTVALGALGDRLLSRGTNGSDVREMQAKLIQLGYPVGPLDGKFGSRTENAVRKFQQDHGLKVDGIAGPKTIGELSHLTGSSTNASGVALGNKSADVNLLAHIVNGEARGEPFIGQVAVAAVVLNRLKNPAFPKTIAGVIYQPGAFSSVSDGQVNKQPTASSIRAAREALSGVDPSHGALYFFNPAKTSNRYIWSRPEITKIGQQIFTS